MYGIHERTAAKGGASPGSGASPAAPGDRPARRRLARVALALGALVAAQDAPRAQAQTTSAPTFYATPWTGTPTAAQIRATALTRPMALRLLARTGFQPSREELDAFMEARTIGKAVNWILHGRDDGQTTKFPLNPTVAQGANSYARDYEARLPWFQTDSLPEKHWIQCGLKQLPSCGHYDAQQGKFMPDDYVHEGEFARWYAWQLVESKSPILERMTLFWHNHFAKSPNWHSGDTVFDLHNKIRKNALNNFRQLLYDDLEDRSMLAYLGQHYASKGNPTANFARELLELHTLGPINLRTGNPNYTEENIREVARVLTGLYWWWDKLPYEWRDERHDYSPSKLIISQPDKKRSVSLTVNYTYSSTTKSYSPSGQGEHRILANLLLDDPNTAEHIVAKLWKEFVSESTVDAGNPDLATVENIAKNFKSSGYRIIPTLEEILTTPQFWDAKNTLVKTPAEFVVGAARELKLNNDRSYMLARSVASAESLTGFTPFYPPNVSGFTTGTPSISSFALGNRQSVAARFASSWYSEVVGSTSSADGTKFVYGFLHKCNKDLPINAAQVDRMRQDRFVVAPMLKLDSLIDANPTYRQSANTCATRTLSDTADGVLTPLEAQTYILADPAYQLK